MREKIEDLFWKIQDSFFDLKAKLPFKKTGRAAGKGDVFSDEQEYRLSGWRRAAEIVLDFMERFRILITVIVLTACVVIGFTVYNRVMVFDGYTVAASYENAVSTGTGYRAIGKDILKYNSDGVTCVSRNNAVRWSITYSLQSPVVDVCDTTMVIAEQHGNQIFVVDENGEIGHFETNVPILTACVSHQGVVAAMLQEDRVTWINLYRADGTLIASDKTTITESGYPLALDLSPNGQRMVVSYIGVDGGVLTDTVSFYQFGTAGQEMENNLIASESFEGEAIPVVYYADNSHVVVVKDDGFLVFEGTDKPKKGEPVNFTSEIVSCFQEDQFIGFVFNNEGTENRYRIELYNLNGKQKMMVETDYRYRDVKMQNGQILLYNDKSCAVYTSRGHLWFYSSYEKEVVDFYYFSEYRKYLVITPDSFDRIRIGKQGGTES